MKKFEVDLIDDHYSCYFSIDAMERKEFNIRKHTGLLKRRFDEQWLSRSHELGSVAQASEYLDIRLNLKKYKSPAESSSFQPARLLKENHFVLDYLRSLEGAEWKLVFRGRNIHRIVAAPGGKEKISTFDHHSMTVKFRPKEGAPFIDVGEGGGPGMKYNQDGVVSRIKEILQNHREQKNVVFHDKVPVILSAGDGGVLFHEILGHSLEADYIHEQRSPFSPAHIGVQIMPSTVTVLTEDKNDPFFKGVKCDDEGETAKNSPLVESGVLRNIIADSFYKNLLNIRSCGFSRVEDFTRQPMPRMFGLYVKPGKYHPDELIASTPLGVYAREFGEGKIDFDRNMFYFHIHDARLIEKGRRTAPLGSIVVRGQITEVLNSVEMIADDFRYDKGVSYCFKNGQMLNVRVGQPTVKVNNLYVTKDCDD